MAIELEILAPGDRPALLGLSSPDLLDYARGVLDQMGYKVHAASTHDEFLERFGRVQYELVFIEDSFGGVLPEQNAALTTLQNMAMPLRRHATVLLLSEVAQTLNPLQAFQQSVHAIIHRADMDKFMLLVQQVVNDNLTFLGVYRDVQARLAQGKR
ncbi:MAG TPA: hypothetical protein VK633_09940 [Verrucomicrobiae bacterium]|nr:hypothetical protein [Verrucomicrobiae bacterium]